MLKREECETVIRRLAIEWMTDTGYEEKRPGWYPSFSSFVSWLESRHYGGYLNFRSKIDPRHEAEGWFESAISEYWAARSG